MTRLCRQALQIQRSYVTATSSAPAGKATNFEVPSLNKRPQPRTSGISADDNGSLTDRLSRETESGRAAASEHSARIDEMIAKRRAERVARESALASLKTSTTRTPRSEAAPRITRTSAPPAGSLPAVPRVQSLQERSNRLAKIREAMKNVKTPEFRGSRRDRQQPSAQASTVVRRVARPRAPTAVEEEEEIFYPTLVALPNGSDPAQRISNDLSDVFWPLPKQIRIPNTSTETPRLYTTPVHKLDISAQLEMATSNSKAIPNVSKGYLTSVVTGTLQKYQKK